METGVGDGVEIGIEPNCTIRQDIAAAGRYKLDSPKVTTVA
jgi:hypothetical protein